MHNPEMGQDAPADPNATTQQQDAQFSTLSNLAQLISGSVPENTADPSAQQPAEADVAPQHQGTNENMVFFLIRKRGFKI